MEKLVVYDSIALISHLLQYFNSLGGYVKWIQAEVLKYLCELSTWDFQYICWTKYVYFRTFIDWQKTELRYL